MGDRLLFQARIKFESASSGEKTTCDAYTWDSAMRCSDIFLYTKKDGVGQYSRVGQIMTNDPDEDGW